MVLFWFELDENLISCSSLAATQFLWSTTVPSLANIKESHWLAFERSRKLKVFFFVLIRILND